MNYYKFTKDIYGLFAAVFFILGSTAIFLVPNLNGQIATLFSFVMSFLSYSYYMDFKIKSLK